LLVVFVVLKFRVLIEENFITWSGHGIMQRIVEVRNESNIAVDQNNLMIAP